MQDASSNGVTLNVRIFDEHVPLRLQKALLKSIFDNYKAASEHCYGTFQPPQAKDLSGIYRRAKIEDEWAGVEAIFKNDVRVKVQPYENHTGFYNEITCGRVRITQSCTLSPNIVPRHAYFRETLASSGQLSLFVEESHEQTQGASYLYAILTHGVDADSPKRSIPWFARIQFPNEDCTDYVDEGIDLFKRFPAIVADYVPQETPEVQPNRRQKRKFGTRE